MSLVIYGQDCQGGLGDNQFEDGDFGSGSRFALASDPGFAPGYRYVSDGPPQDGEYIITNNIAEWLFVFETWLVTRDNSSDPFGYMMVVNASFEPGLFYEETITDLCDNTQFEFSADILNMIRRGVTDHSDPNVDFLINDEVVLSTGNIPKNEIWNTYSFSFFTEPGQTSVKLSLRNNAPGGIGNDLALDNISFRACGPVAEIAELDFSSTCLEDIPITLTALLDGEEQTDRAYRWEILRSADEGWLEIGDATSSQLTIDTIAPGTRQFRFASAASPSSITNPKCRFFSEPLTVIVPQRIYERNDTICGGNSLPFDPSQQATPGLYVLELMASSTGCDSIVRIELDTVPRQVLSAEYVPIDPFCFGTASGSIAGTNVSGGVTPYRIVANGQAFDDLVAFGLGGGTYTVRVEDRFRCFTEEEVILVEPTEFNIDLGPDLDLILGDVVNVEVNATDQIRSTFWSEGLSEFDGETAIQVLPTQPGQIGVTATNLRGCPDSDTISITLSTEVDIYVPNAFSPNGDRINDEYFISSYGRSLGSIEQFIIYDRWGKEIWGFDDVQADPFALTNAWDGTDRSGDLVSPGVYAFIMKAVLINGDVIEEVGTVTVIN
ncbi:MAG: gliding motility-associated C-terminal domain-containing protein [Bacteroidota bacterium]